jgi:hypothetical protein
VPGAPPVDAVSDPLSPSLELEGDDELDERLPEEEELLLLDRLLELEGIDGIEAVDEEEDELGSDGAREEDEDEDELGIEGDEEEDEELDDELGIDGMPLLLELCWVDSHPAKIRASTEAPIKEAARRTRKAGIKRRLDAGVFMVASMTFEGVRSPQVPPVRHFTRTRRGIL